MTRDYRQPVNAATTVIPPRWQGGWFGSVFHGRQSVESPAGTLSVPRMEYDKDKVDEMVLALLFLTLHGDGRAWKGHDWDAMDRLHQKGMIFDPVGKAKSVVLTEESEKRCRELFRKHFCGGKA